MRVLIDIPAASYDDLVEFVNRVSPHPGNAILEVSDSELCCPRCHGAVTHYDGALGYEAIRCFTCNLEFDLNSDNFSEIPDGARP